MLISSSVILTTPYKNSNIPKANSTSAHKIEHTLINPMDLKYKNNTSFCKSNVLPGCPLQDIVEQIIAVTGQAGDGSHDHAVDLQYVSHRTAAPRPET